MRVKVWIVWAGVRREDGSEAYRFAVYAPTRLFATWHARDVMRASRPGVPFVGLSVLVYSAPRVLRKGEAIPSPDFAVAPSVARYVALPR